MNRQLDAHRNKLTAALLLSTLLTFNTAMASVVATYEPHANWCGQSSGSDSGLSTFNPQAEQWHQRPPIAELPAKPRYLKISAQANEQFSQRWQHRLPLTKVQSPANHSLEQLCLLPPDQGQQATPVKTTGRSWVF